MSDQNLVCWLSSSFSRGAAVHKFWARMSLAIGIGSRRVWTKLPVKFWDWGDNPMSRSVHVIERFLASHLPGDNPARFGPKLPRSPEARSLEEPTPLKKWRVHRSYSAIEPDRSKYANEALKSCTKRLFPSIERPVSGKSLRIYARQSSRPLAIKLDENDVLVWDPTVALRAIDSLLIAAKGYRF